MNRSLLFNEVTFGSFSRKSLRRDLDAQCESIQLADLIQLAGRTASHRPLEEGGACWRQPAPDPPPSCLRPPTPPLLPWGAGLSRAPRLRCIPAPPSCARWCACLYTMLALWWLVLAALCWKYYKGHFEVLCVEHRDLLLLVLVHLYSAVCTRLCINTQWLSVLGRALQVLSVQGRALPGRNFHS